MAYAEFAVKRDESVTDCSSRVNHPTTPKCSGNLVGETTRRYALNPDRGSGPLDAQRIVGKREPHTGNREMLPTPGEAPKGSIFNRTSFLGVIPSINRPGSTTEGSTGVKSMDIPGLDTAAWERWVAYRKAIKKPLKEASLHAAAIKLSKFGADQAEVIDQSIGNQWTGLFPLPVKKLAPGEKPKKTREQVAADDAYWQATVQRAEKNWSEMIPTAFGRLKVCDALWARYTIEVGPDTPDKMDWLKGVVARNLKEAEAKDIVNDPHLMIMVMCFFGPSGVKRIRERAAVGA